MNDTIATNFARATFSNALGASWMLLAATLSAAETDIYRSPVQVHPAGTAATNLGSHIVTEANETALGTAMFKVFRDISAGQTELDQDSKSVLFKNLRDLYRR